MIFLQNTLKKFLRALLLGKTAVVTFSFHSVLMNMLALTFSEHLLCARAELGWSIQRRAGPSSSGVTSGKSVEGYRSFYSSPRVENGVKGATLRDSAELVHVKV